jgi:ferredoxin
MIVHLLEALRWASDQPCDRRNCGSVCLCGPCHARRTLAILDPAYQPKHRKNFYFPVRLDDSRLDCAVRKVRRILGDPTKTVKGGKRERRSAGTS